MPIELAVTRLVRKWPLLLELAIQILLGGVVTVWQSLPLQGKVFIAESALLVTHTKLTERDPVLIFGRHRAQLSIGRDFNRLRNSLY